MKHSPHIWHYIACHKFFSLWIFTWIYLLLSSRVSKTHKYKDACLHKFSIICRNFDFGVQNWQNRHFFLFLVQFDKVLMNLLCFKAIKVFNSGQNYLRQNSVCAKQFTFGRSAVPCLWKEYQDEIECQETFSNQALANWTYVEKIFRTVKYCFCYTLYSSLVK